MSDDRPPLPANHRCLAALGWTATILVSALPDIVCLETTHALPAWLVPAKAGLLVVLVIAAQLSAPLRPLRNFGLLLVVFFGLGALRQRVDFTLPGLQSALGGSPFDVRMQAEQTGKLAAALVMIGALLALGYRRRDFFLVRGALRAPIEPVPLLGFPRPVAWPRFGLQWALYIAVALAVLQYLALRPAGTVLLKVPAMLPSILFYAALNAFNEELLYRAPMLATLEPAGGSRHALWMSAYFFGIGHYFGTPGGLGGGIASVFMGWILGKGMVETRGLFWTWWIHFLSDVAIFFFLAAALVT